MEEILLFQKKIILFQIKLVNINASDVVDGKSAVVLGLIWTIILYFQVISIIPEFIFQNYILNKQSIKLFIICAQLRCNDLLVVSFSVMHEIVILKTNHFIDILAHLNI